MTGELYMLDSVTPANLPRGADAYLGYVNGQWPTYDTVKAMFPGVPVLGLTVFPGTRAEGCDCETGDLTIGQVPAWVRGELDAGARLPVVYMGAANMRPVLGALSAAGIARNQVRLLSAHYGAGNHICGPITCGYPQADGTQWTDTAPGLHESQIDQSLLSPGFFGTLTPKEEILFIILDLAATPGAVAPLAIPDGTTRLRFYTNDKATLRVSFPHVQPDTTLNLTYGVPQSVPLNGAECVEVYRTDTGTSRVSCAGY